ncbi:hypothetical protein Golomagni_01020 [Golovinomyces magnicellulatus]|nr:hypothetical protein Golomagni_01020 [Golovinomyces magnicellulatus]
MQSSPVPSHLTLLSNLKSFPQDSKVRFLGCVTKYSDHDAILTLEHNYPPGNKLYVRLDITLLLGNMQCTHCQIGSWINVIGYIKSTLSKSPTAAGIFVVYVQAILLWSVGPSRIDGYEKTLELAHAENQRH